MSKLTHLNISGDTTGINDCGLHHKQVHILGFPLENITGVEIQLKVHGQPMFKMFVGY